jgi:ribonucleoside-diphosphate reductase alpha chain
LDNIIKKVVSDPEPEHIKQVELDLWKKIKTACLNGRRTGLGITALGDALAALNIKYGEQKSIEMTENIYRHLCVSSYAESINLAKERGSFEVFSYELEKDHPFVSKVIKEVGQMFGEDLVEDYKKYGRRNIANTTTAPTGTVSTQTQTTSGIEPAYLLKYDRYRKVNSGDSNVTVDRIDDVGDAWQKYTVYHHQFKKWQEITGKSEIDQSPYYKATANDIDWISSVDIQAAAQRWIDHSISKTCNIPSDASEDLVADIYLKAWESGCKGFTVYRDGCRDGVLVKPKEDEEEDNKNKRMAPSRPRTLRSETHKIKLDIGDGVKNSYVTVAFFPETRKPYEVFINTPVGNNLKDLQILELSARMTSLALRHGVDVKFIIDQLQKIDGQYIFSIPNSLAKSLSKYVDMNDFVKEEDEGTINEETENESSFKDKKVSLKSGSKCPNCGKYTYIQKEGCGACLDCGYSGCS